jgi:hypothetical protein
LVNPLTIVSHIWQYSSLLSHQRTMRNQLIKKVRLSSKSWAWKCKVKWTMYQNW